MPARHAHMTIELRHHSTQPAAYCRCLLKNAKKWDCQQPV